MRIAVLSGKGGAGKTTVAAALSLYMEDVTYVDMDAEEPNGHLFLQPEIEETQVVNRPVPEVNTELCSFCGKCQEVCKFNAITVIRSLKSVMVHEDLCHHCGACSIICPEQGALLETDKRVGEIKRGHSGLHKKTGFLEARMDTGQSSSVPVLSALDDILVADSTYILDAPPGTSCPVVEVLDQADFVILVTEPTPFGLSDLELSLELVRSMHKPHALVINKQDLENSLARDFAEKHDIEVLGYIPFDRDIARHYADGTLFTQTPPIFKSAIEKIVYRLGLTLASKGKVEING